MDYACPDPTATVRAANVRATLEAFRLLPHVGKRIVERHALHLEDLTPDRFIPVQSWLDALRDIETQVQGIVANRRGSSRYTVQYTPGPDTGPLTCTLTVRKL